MDNLKQLLSKVKTDLDIQLAVNILTAEGYEFQVKLLHDCCIIEVYCMYCIVLTQLGLTYIALDNF